MDRQYGSSFNQQHSSPVFNYIEDTTANSGSGAWRPMRQTDLGTTIGSGATVNFDTSPIVAAQASGNVNTAAASVTCSINFTGSLTVSAAKEIHSIFGYNSGNSQFARVYNGTGSNGTLLAMIAISAQNNFSIDFTPHGSKSIAGIFVAFSSSASSYVAATNPDGIITIIWK